MRTTGRFQRIACAACALAMIQESARAEDAPPTTAPTTSKLVAAADAFLATLDAKQQARVVYRFDDADQRARWSNFPIGIVSRGGLSLQELNGSQRAAAMAVVAAALSPRGYEKVLQIMDGDEYLKSHDSGPGGGRGPGGRGGGGGLVFGKELYFLSFVGRPSKSEPWMLQFGGHHLALNLTVVGDKGVLTPSLTAAQPASFPLDGKTIRPLGAESDKALALLMALDENQRKQAVLDYRVGDLVLGPGRDGETIQPEGLKVSAMSDAQRAMLLDLVAEWAGIASDGYAAARLDEIRAGLAQTYFAWSGPTNGEAGKSITAYYRIQGPKLVIEYAPQRGSEHVHTIYRDPTNDYGRALVAKK